MLHSFFVFNVDPTLTDGVSMEIDVTIKVFTKGTTKVDNEFKMADF